MTKMTKTQIYELKKKHRLEIVMQEAGEAFEADPKNSDLWRSTITPGLVVDLRRQSWEINVPGMDKKSGDVIEWLKLRYSWSFGQIIKYLSRRPTDPKRKDPPRALKQEQMLPEAEPVDDLQAHALELAGDRIRGYFSWSFWELVLYLDEIRIEPVHAPDITHCGRCDKRLDWYGEAQKHLEMIPARFGYRLQYVGDLPVIAYSIKRRLKLSDVDLKGSEALEDLTYDLGSVFVEEEDGIVCRSCAWDEYKFQIALSLVKRAAGSAAQRDTAAGAKHK